MSFIATAIGVSGAIGAGASIYAANKQTSAANNAITAQTNMFNTAKGEEQPFIDAGSSAAGTLSGLLKPGADMSSILGNIPGMKFLQQLTQEGVSNQGTTTGLGGNTLLAGANAGNQIALGGWGSIVNALQGLVTTGAGSANALGGQAIQTGGQIGSNLVGIGNAQAGAATSVGSNIGNSLTTAALFSKLLGQNNSMYATPADAGTGGGVGTGGFNFLDKIAGTPASFGTG